MDSGGSVSNEHGIKSSGFIHGIELIGPLRNTQLLNKESLLIGVTNAFSFISVLRRFYSETKKFYFRRSQKINSDSRR